MTTNVEQTPANRLRIDQAETALAELLAAALRRGFYGNVAIELSIQDGTIQHLCRRMNQIEK